MTVSNRMLSLSFHLASGITLAVVSIELMPEVLQVQSPWIVLLAFVAGGTFFTLLDEAMDLVKSRFGEEETDTSPWAIYFGVTVDPFSDGLMIGTGSTVSPALGLLLVHGRLCRYPRRLCDHCYFQAEGCNKSIKGYAFSRFYYLHPAWGFNRVLPDEEWARVIEAQHACFYSRDPVNYSGRRDDERSASRA